MTVWDESLPSLLNTFFNIHSPPPKKPEKQQKLNYRSSKLAVGKISYVLLLWLSHLAGSSSCSSRRLCTYRPEEAWRPLYRGVSSPVEQNVSVTRHHLTLVHHCHGAVIKQTPAWESRREERPINGSKMAEWNLLYNFHIHKNRCHWWDLPTSLRWLFLSLGRRA